MDDTLIEARIGKGKALLAVGNSQEAFTCFRKVVEIDSESSEGWGGIGSCLLALGKYNEALQAYEKASSSKNSYNLNGLGEIYYKLEAYSKALETFKRVLTFDPENLFAWNGKGNALCKLGKYREALEAYENLLTLDYESLPARYNKGVVLSRLKIRNKNNFEQTLENQLQTAFKKYLELSGKYSDGEFDIKGWKYRGFAFAELAQYREALKAFENNLKSEKEDPFSEIYKGITLICLEKYKEALEAFETAEEALETLYPVKDTAAENKQKDRKEKEKERSGLESEFLNYPDGKSQLEILRTAKGFALDALGRHKDALQAFAGVKGISEEGKVAAFGEGLVFVHCNEWENSLKTFNRILPLDPEYPQALVIKSYIFIQLQESEKAIRVLKNLSGERMKDEWVPSSISTICSDLPYCLSGFACSKLGDFEGALLAYKKALETNPKNIHARNGLAELYFRLGNNKGALKELEASITEAPDNVFSRNLKGRIDLEEQAYEDALEAFRRALALDPENRKLLLWDTYARYIYAEASFGEESARFRHILLAAAGKLEKANLDHNLDLELENSKSEKPKSEYPELKNLKLENLELKDLKGINLKLEDLRSENKELRAYTLYFLGLFYYRTRYFQKATQRLEECVDLKTSTQVEKSAVLLLKNIRAGPLRPAWWEWWLYSEPHGLLKK